MTGVRTDGRRNERPLNAASGRTRRTGVPDRPRQLRSPPPATQRAARARASSLLRGPPLREMLDDAGVTMDSLVAVATGVHAILAERLGDDDLSRAIGEHCFRLQRPADYERIVAAVDYPATSHWLGSPAWPRASRRRPASR